MKGFIVESIIDLLPEEDYYPDLGCDLFPACLSCPLPRCRYDEPEALKYGSKRRRNKEVMRLKNNEGMTIKQLASAFGLSRRTIHRIIGRSKNE